MFLLHLFFTLFIGQNLFANELFIDKEKEAIEKSCYAYIDGFVEGKPDLLAKALSKDLYKFGFRKNADTDKFEHAGVLTFESSQELAKRIGENGGRFDPKAPRKVEVLDLQGPIASVKITAVWGYDYALLAKNEQGDWKIEHVLWVGPLEKTNADE